MLVWTIERDYLSGEIVQWLKSLPEAQRSEFKIPKTLCKFHVDMMAYLLIPALGKGGQDP